MLANQILALYHLQHASVAEGVWLVTYGVVCARATTASPQQTDDEGRTEWQTSRPYNHTHMGPELPEGASNHSS